MIVRVAPTYLAISSLPRLRGRVGVGESDQPDPLPTYPVSDCPHPSLPPLAGEGAPQ